MITNLIVNFFLIIFGWVFTILPPVTIASIPFIGSFVSSTLLSVVRTWNSFIVVFPYADIGFKVFLYVILPFEGLMLVGKMVLGSRMPNHQ